jgi:hypothetical protein
VASSIAVTSAGSPIEVMPYGGATAVVWRAEWEWEDRAMGARAALTPTVRVWPSTATNPGPTATGSYWCPKRTGQGRCCVVLAPADCGAAEDGR